MHDAYLITLHTALIWLILVSVFTCQLITCAAFLALCFSDQENRNTAFLCNYLWGVSAVSGLVAAGC